MHTDASFSLCFPEQRGGSRVIYSENILICIVIPLVITLLYVRGRTRRFVVCFLVGMITCLLSSYISGYISILAEEEMIDTAVYIAPIVEEVLKLLPVLFIFYVFSPKDRHIFVDAVAIGAGFATFENCCYILLSGMESLSYTLIRGLAAGVMHIDCMLAVAFGLVAVRRYRAFSFPGIVGVLSLSATYHALYNLLVSVPGSSEQTGYCLPILTAIILYLPYRNIIRKPGNR